MSQEAFLAAIPEEVIIVKRGPEFITVRYSDDESGMKKISHVWFLQGRLQSVPQKKI
jgi:hypothetical protein